ncbi:MAG: helix-turn-helix domain-containing protein, partial [Sphingomonadales bacterium]|nr:helix-turn-helix domain-containing protein [Sphingomonadales bacterium]
MKLAIDKDPEYLSTLERGLRVLGIFSSQRPEMALSEVAAEVDLSPAVARRCLNTLVALGYVAKVGKRFALRPKVLEFGDAFLSSAHIEQIVTPFLQSLRDDTGDSASMAARVDDNAMYIAHVSTQRQIRLAAHPGTRFPLHAT